MGILLYKSSSEEVKYDGDEEFLEFNDFVKKNDIIIIKFNNVNDKSINLCGLNLFQLEIINSNIILSLESSLINDLNIIQENNYKNSRKEPSSFYLKVKNCNIHNVYFSKVYFKKLDITNCFIKKLNCFTCVLNVLTFYNVFSVSTNFSWNTLVCWHFTNCSFKSGNFVKNIFHYSPSCNCFEFTDLFESEFIDNKFNDGSYIKNLFKSGLFENCNYINSLVPTEGSFIVWKAALIGDCVKVLVKLLIPDDALRCNSTEYKCRANKAKVLAITDIEETINYEQAYSIHNKDFKYYVNEMVYSDKFIDDNKLTCTNGIHFFIDKEMAKNY